MLNIYNILWVIPGIIFIFIYNKTRPEQAIVLSGWLYVFSLVFIASLTWIPSELIVIATFDWFKTYHWLNDLNENLLKQILTLLFAIIFSIFWLLLVRIRLISEWIFPSVQDNFYKKCVEWENEDILLTLKNGKAYIGVLWKYPENPRSRHESQTISIIPIRSGYRKQDTKQVVWDTNYPHYETASDFIDMELMIPRSEILTYGKFSKKTFKHFYNIQEEYVK